MNKTIKAARVMIAATGSGKGKTTITSVLLSMLKDMSCDVHGFKCGPDYIDPMYHEAVLGVPSKNLDPFFCDEELMKASFIDGCGRVSIIEGCMGLYDGIGVSRDCSPYTVAMNLNCPIILVVDGYGKGYSIVAEIKGFLALDDKHLIKGIIINRISEGYYQKIKEEIEKIIGITVLGFMPRIQEELFESRHLGLKSVIENHAKAKIESLKTLVSNNFDIENILKIASDAPGLSYDRTLADYCEKSLTGKTVAVAKDEAFNFYYRDNLRAIELSGATIKYFSPLHDSRVPKDVDSIYYGGGYPELYAEELMENTSMRNAVLEFIQNGGKVFGECGGYMYLNRTIENHEMIGVFDGDAVNKGKLVRFGYVNAVHEEIKVKAHEFHHYDVENSGNVFMVEKASNGANYFAGEKAYNCVASFLHLFFMSNPKIIEQLF